MRRRHRDHFDLQLCCLFHFLLFHFLFISLLFFLEKAEFCPDGIDSDWRCSGGERRIWSGLHRGRSPAGTYLERSPSACFPPFLSEFLVEDLGQLCNPSDAAAFLFPNAIRAQGEIATDLLMTWLQSFWSCLELTNRRRMSPDTLNTRLV